VCGYVHEGTRRTANCPSAARRPRKFVRLDEAAAGKIYASDRTNDIHMEIVTLAPRIAKLCKEGLAIGLDPGCIDVFNKAKDESWIIKQRSKAEMATHMEKGKW
jgi:hypothetical protein